MRKTVLARRPASLERLRVCLSPPCDELERRIEPVHQLRAQRGGPAGFKPRFPQPHAAGHGALEGLGQCWRISIARPELRALGAVSPRSTKRSSAMRPVARHCSMPTCTCQPDQRYGGRRFQVVIDLARPTRCARSFADDYYVVVTNGPRTRTEEIRHAYHYLIDPLSIRFQQNLEPKRPMATWRMFRRY